MSLITFHLHVLKGPGRLGLVALGREGLPQEVLVTQPHRMELGNRLHSTLEVGEVERSCTSFSLMDTSRLFLALLFSNFVSPMQWPNMHTHKELPYRYLFSNKEKGKSFAKNFMHFF